MNIRRLRTRARNGSRTGLTIIEIVVAAGILAVVMLASAAAMGSSVESTEVSKRLMHGATFMESVQEDLSTLQTVDLPAMNGQLVYSHDDWTTARFRVEITVFETGIDLLQIELALVDQVRDETVATLHTMRADV